MLLNRQILAQFSPLPKNFDFTEVMQYVDIAELIWIVPILKEPLYEELLEQVKNNTLTPQNSTLLVEAVYPYLGFAVVYEALPMLWSEISEVGVVKGKSENFDSLTLKDMTYVQNHLRQQLEARKDHCIKWLDSHWESFPLYVPSTCQCGAPTADKCVCGAIWGELHHPNKYQQLFAPRKKCVEIN